VAARKKTRNAVKPSESAEQNREKLPNCGEVGDSDSDSGGWGVEKKTCSHLRGVEGLRGRLAMGWAWQGRHSPLEIFVRTAYRIRGANIK